MDKLSCVIKYMKILFVLCFVNICQPSKAIMVACSVPIKQFDPDHGLVADIDMCLK